MKKATPQYQQSSPSQGQSITVLSLFTVEEIVGVLLSVTNSSSGSRFCGGSAYPVLQGGEASAALVGAAGYSDNTCCSCWV